MSFPKHRIVPSLALAALALAGCGGDNNLIEMDAKYQADAEAAVKKQIAGHLDDLTAAVTALRAAVPAPDADGWNASDDAAAVMAMRDQWKKARAAYETIEGALAIVYPDLDVSVDARYDYFIATAPDDDLFDDMGVTGMHAVERILWSDSIPPRVVMFESALPGYQAAAFPTTETQAAEFRDKLCARLVTDITSMRDQWKSYELDAPTAYHGVLGSMKEQVEKVRNAATGQEESRYAQYTLADMRANVAAGKATYADFHDWVLFKQGGDALDQEVASRFATLEQGYAAVTGDALPPVPDGWSSVMPTDAQLATPFGKLYAVVSQQSDPTVNDSLVAALTDAEHLLGAW
jgi:iron uptake system component EfeO